VRHPLARSPVRRVCPKVCAHFSFLPFHCLSDGGGGREALRSKLYSFPMVKGSPGPDPPLFTFSLFFFLLQARPPSSPAVSTPSSKPLLVAKSSTPPASPALRSPKSPAAPTEPPSFMMGGWRPPSRTDVIAAPAASVTPPRPNSVPRQRSDTALHSSGSLQTRMRPREVSLFFDPSG